MMSYLPETFEDIRYLMEVSEKLGGVSTSCIGIESNDIFTHETLSRIKISTEGKRVDRNILEIVSCDGNPPLDFSRKEELIKPGEDTMESYKKEILRHFKLKRWGIL
jgi:hypothetical protein